VYTFGFSGFVVVSSFDWQFTSLTTMQKIAIAKKTDFVRFIIAKTLPTSDQILGLFADRLNEHD